VIVRVEQSVVSEYFWIIGCCSLLCALLLPSITTNNEEFTVVDYTKQYCDVSFIANSK
jgi:hypothetical protein